MISEGVIGTINAYAECLKGFTFFLDKCDNIDDLRNMALVFRAYQNEYKSGGWVGEKVANLLLDVSVRIAAGDNPEDITSLLHGCPDSKYSPASNISYHLWRLLMWLEDPDLEFIAGLLRAILEGHTQEPSKLSPRDAVALFMTKQDTSKPATLLFTAARVLSDQREEESSVTAPANSAD
jgi:hypothetical protein